MYVIGLTGMIASGKSTVSAYLREQNLPVIDADEISHQVILQGRPAYDDIVAYFGETYVGQGGQIDRRKLGATVFADAQKLQKLNSIVHPRVIDEIHTQVQVQAHIAVIDAPLLVQAGLDRMCDEIWNVCAPEALRIARIIQRDGLSEAQAKARVASQQVTMPADKPVYTIDNAGDYTHLLEQVKALVQRIKEYEQTT